MEKILTENEIRENRITWIEALESGKYSQCRRVLYHPDANSFCCLGVAIKVLTGYVPPSSFETYEQIDNLLNISGMRNVFINMNDENLKSFQEIAQEARRMFNLPKVEGKENAIPERTS